MKNSIEEDVKILETWLEELSELFNKNHINNTKERNALSNILSDYKRVLKENEELTISNKEIDKECSRLEAKEKSRNREPVLINNKMYFIDKNLYEDLLNDIKSNYIPTQKVKDKIEKLNDESHAEELEDIMIGDNYTITELVQYVLQELIEEREVK